MGVRWGCSIDSAGTPAYDRGMISWSQRMIVVIDIARPSCDWIPGGECMVQTSAMLATLPARSGIGQPEIGHRCSSGAMTASVTDTPGWVTPSGS